jgi:hypothetical protein
VDNDCRQAAVGTSRVRTSKTGLHEAVTVSDARSLTQLLVDDYARTGAFGEVIGKPAPTRRLGPWRGSVAACPPSRLER